MVKTIWEVFFMRCLISVDGGMGKNVMFTAIMPIIAKKYEEIYE